MLRKRIVVAVVFALCLQLVVPFLSSQAVVEPYDLARLVREAGGIVWAQVLNVVPHWNAEHTYISSTVTLAANQYFKGVGENKVTLEVAGGEVDGIGQWVEDAPNFAAGEEVVVFLDGAQTAVLGWNQGKFTSVDGLVLENNMMPLGQFIGQIQAELNAQGYVKPQVAPEKGLTEPTSIEFVQADASMATKVTEISKDGKEGAAASELSYTRPDAYQVIEHETFEGIWPDTGWAIAGSPAWDDTSYRAFNGSWSGWCADTTIAPPGPYPANMNGWMIYGPFSLVGVSDADMWFRHWTKTELNYDYLNVGASIDGNYFYGWRISGDYTGASGNESGWVKGDFDLTNVYGLGDLRGQANVWIAFWFTSDNIIQYEGSYLDDVVIWKDVGSGNPPMINNVKPTSAPAGTSTNVKIYGRSFGGTQGSSTVKFWYSGSSWTTAPIVSWANDRIVCQVPAPASSHTSQALKVTTAGGIAYAGFTIQYSVFPFKWPGTTVMPKYYVGTGTADCTGEATALTQAAHTWTNVDYTYHALKYFGGSTRGVPVYDGYNVLGWGATGGSIATCTTWYSGANILEFDIEFEDGYSWSSASTCPAGSMDVWNIGIHEMGHGGVGFYDMYGSADSEKTMYGYGANGETKKRSLYSTDIAGIQWLY